LPDDKPERALGDEVWITPDVSLLDEQWRHLDGRRHDVGRRHEAELRPRRDNEVSTRS
jgi:hypothetical protein